MTSNSLVCPFAVTIEPIAAMLNFEIAGDPTYAGLEIQRFDDPIHGSGLAVLLMRRDDRRADVYRQPGLSIDRGGYGIGAGVGEWREADISPAQLEVTRNGVVAHVALRDAEGRLIEVHVDDRDRHRRSPGSLLAPVSAGIERPTSMLLVWMPRFDLARTGGRQPMVTIDGHEVSTGRLPAAWLHRRRLIKYAADLVVVQLNPVVDGPAPTVDPGDPGPAAIATRNGRAAIAGVTGRTTGHEVRLQLRPPVPDLGGLTDGASVGGRWRLGIDRAASVVSGTWSARRTGDRVDLTLDSTAPWRPGRLPLLMRIVTRIVPTFRAWPRTYRWEATLSLGAGGPRLTSRWERTSEVRDETYRRLTGSGR